LNPALGRKKAAIAMTFGEQMGKSKYGLDIKLGILSGIMVSI